MQMDHIDFLQTLIYKDKEVWGQGLAFEACQCLVEYAFKTLKLLRLVGAAALENRRSVNLQKRLGYQVFRNNHTHNEDVGSSQSVGEAPGWVTVLTNPSLSEPTEGPTS